MPAQPESYVIASGGVLAAGRHVLPSWRMAIAPLTWAEIGTNTLSDVNPENDAAVNPNHPSAAPWHGVGGQVTMISAWSGGIWDEVEKKLFIYGGGHADYAGNEVYAWDGRSATFSRLCNPTGAIGNTGTLNDGNDASGVYFDGKPRSVHSYNNFALRNGDWWTFGGSSYITGTGANAAFRWNGSEMVRESPGTIAARYGGACYDSTRDIFWLIDGGTAQPRQYNPVTETQITKSLWVNLAGTYVKPHYNAARDIVVLFGSSLHVLSGDGLSNSVAPPIAGTPPGFGLSTAGSHYDAAHDRFLVWGGGTSIYVLTPPALGEDPKTAAWTWSEITASSGSPSAPQANGTYGRFWHSNSLRCCGVLNAVNQKMHVFALD